MSRSFEDRVARVVVKVLVKYLGPEAIASNPQTQNLNGRRFVPLQECSDFEDDQLWLSPEEQPVPKKPPTAPSGYVDGVTLDGSDLLVHYANGTTVRLSGVVGKDGVDGAPGAPGVNGINGTNAQTVVIENNHYFCCG